MLRALVNSENELIAYRAKEGLKTGVYVDSGGFYDAVWEGDLPLAFQRADAANKKCLSNLINELCDRGVL